MRDKKKIIIGVLCALVGIMAVGYAALATQLNITGTSSIDSTWKVEITNITEGNIVGDATSKETPSYTATTANFSVGLIQPGDSITYDIEVSNLGTLAAKVDSINVVLDENDAITYTTEGLEAGDKLGVNEKDTLSVTVAYNPEVTSQPSVTAKDITVTINYVQDLGTEGSVTLDTYSIGDTVTFAGSNWYVIKDSTADEDYVTLMKEKVLTSSELGEYAANHTYTCVEYHVTNNLYGCTTVGEEATVEYDTMSYYWSDDCHSSFVYGYDSSGNFRGCSGHNDYEGSKVKEYLEGKYINTLGENNLKEVDGYKIRLITLDELQTNLGYETEKQYFYNGTTYYYYYNNGAENTPVWLYQTFGSTNVDKYYTMTPAATGRSAHALWIVTSEGLVTDEGSAASTDVGVRPVINLLKSSI